jgi:hypothetical protein
LKKKLSAAHPFNLRSLAMVVNEGGARRGGKRTSGRGALTRPGGEPL